MKAKEVRELLSDGFKEVLKPFGFNGSNGDFKRKNINNTNYLGYGLRSYGELFMTSIAFGNIDHRLNSIYKYILGVKHDVACTSMTYANFLNKSHHDFEIRTKDDVQNWLSEVSFFLRKKGFHFFEEYVDYISLDRLYNEKPEEKLKFCSNQVQRACMGLILAKINQGSNYKELIEKYEESVVDLVDKDNLIVFIDFLADKDSEWLLKFSIG